MSNQIEVNKIETNKFGEISLKDLQGGSSFESWVKNNIAIYRNKRVPHEHLLIYLHYIQEVIKKSKDKDNSFWSEVARDLEKRLKVKESYVI